MNTFLLTIFFIAFVATGILGQEFGPCIGGTCPSGYTCNSAGTCVGSSSSTCFDIATNCATNAALCTNPIYQQLMAQKCRKTCNICNANGGSCTDVASNCQAVYCNNAFYRDLMSRQCRRTCGSC